MYSMYRYLPTSLEVTGYTTGTNSAILSVRNIRQKGIFGFGLFLQGFSDPPSSECGWGKKEYLVAVPVQ